MRCIHLSDNHNGIYLLIEDTPFEVTFCDRKILYILYDLLDVKSLFIR